MDNLNTHSVSSLYEALTGRYGSLQTSATKEVHKKNSKEDSQKITSFDLGGQVHEKLKRLFTTQTNSKIICSYGMNESDRLCSENFAS